jgi:hypothetical protein
LPLARRRIFGFGVAWLRGAIYVFAAAYRGKGLPFDARGTRIKPHSRRGVLLWLIYLASIK